MKAPEHSDDIGSEDDLSPEMRALVPQQRLFVTLYVRGSKNASEAARNAGYSTQGGSNRVAAHRLLHTPAVAKAIRVESERHLGTSVPLAVDGLVTIVRDPKHPHQLKAIDSLLDRAGLARQRQLDVSVETYDKRSTAELLELIERYKARHPMRVIEATADVRSALSAPKHQAEGE